jgi:hypothetical protein
MPNNSGWDNKYRKLKQKLQNDEELSDKEWKLFLQLEEEIPEVQADSTQWESTFTDSIILERQNQSSAYKTPLNTGVKPAKKKAHFIYFAYSGAFAVTIVIMACLFFPYPYKTHITSHTVKTKPALVSVAGQVKVPARHQLHKSIAEEEYPTNPYLEAYIDDNVRSASISLHISIPKPGAIYKETLSSVSFFGTAHLLEKQPDMEMTIKIYTNNKEDYLNEKVLASSSFILSNEGGSTSFNEKILANFVRGLYYYTFEDKETGKVLKAGKFAVK